jgi:hypothetical protein
MRHQTWLALIATAGMALTGCANMHWGSDSDQADSSSSGTMRRAESGSNTSTNSTTRNSDCLPGDTRQHCAPATTEGSRTTEPATDATTTPESSAPPPR